MFNHPTRELGSYHLMRNPELLNVKTPLVVRPPGRWALAYAIIVIDAPLLIAIHMKYVHLRVARYLPDARITYNRPSSCSIMQALG